jgi:hypothetical protein
MIIQLDFITNSSSTSYVAIIPKNFIVIEKDVESIIENEFGGQEYYDEGNTLEETFNNIRTAVERLKEEEELWAEDCGFENHQIVHELLDRYGLIMADFESGPDSGLIIPITQKTTDKAIKTYEKMTKKETKK